MSDPTSDKTGVKQDSKFQPGKSGNPAGRPKGARSKLSEAFLKAMCEDFEQHGAIAVETVRTEKPEQYLKVIASILPKEITGEDGAPIEMVHRIELIAKRADGNSPA